MNSNRYFIVSIGIAILIFTVLSSCIEKPLSPVMPEWDITLNIPNYYNKTLGDLIKNSADSEITYDSGRDSLIIYSTDLDIEPVFLSDSIKFTPEKVETNALLSEFTFQPSQKFNYTFSFNDLFPNLPSGNIIIPSLSKDLSRNITITEFQYLEIESGKCIITINNKFPFEAEFKTPIIFYNTSDKSEIIRVSISSRIAPFGSISIELDLNGKKIYNDVTANFTISTPGTSAPVQINGSNFIQINLSLKDIKIKSGSGSLGSQKYTSLNSFHFDSADIPDLYLLKLKTGYAFLELQNSSNFGLQINIEMKEIIKSGKPAVFGTHLYPRQVTKSQVIDLSGYTVQPNNNIINYNLEIITDNNSGQPISFSKDDYIKCKVFFENIVIDNFEGKLKPTSTKINETVEVPIDKIRKYIDGSALISEVLVELKIDNRIGAPFQITNANITGFNSYNNKNEILNIPDLLIEQRSIKKIYLDKASTSKFLNSFLEHNSFPAEYKFQANATINPEQKLCNIYSNDYINGKIRFEIPLQVSILNISSKDTMEVNFSNSEKDQMDDFNSGRLSLKIENSIPANCKLGIVFLDSKKSRILTLPKDVIYYSIPSPELNSDGTVKTPSGAVYPASYSSLTREEILKIKESKYCVYNVIVNSTGAPNTYVKFRKQDRIKINMMLELGYHVKEK